MVTKPGRFGRLCVGDSADCKCGVFGEDLFLSLGEFVEKVGSTHSVHGSCL